MADLHDFLLRLKNQPGGSADAPSPAPAVMSSGNNSQDYHQPTVSSPIFSPPPTGPQPHHQSAILSPNTSAANTPVPDASSSDRTASLLNLLRFNHPSTSSASGAIESRSSQPAPQPQDAPVANPSPISASDLVAQLTRKPPSSAPQAASILSPAPAKPLPRRELTPSSSENAQEFLLKLLNNKAARDDAAAAAAGIPPPAPDSPQPKEPERAVTPVRVFGSGENEQVTPFEPPEAAKKGSIFTYVNPFEQLSASSPRNRSPKPETRQESRTSSLPTRVEILKPNRSLSPLKHEATKVDAREPSSAAELAATDTNFKRARRDSPESVARALSEVGEQVDKQLEETLSSVKENENGPSEKKAHESTDDGAVKEPIVEPKQEQTAEDDPVKLKEIPVKPKTETRPDNAKTTGQDILADSWESADEDDSPAKEDEQSVVRVYNFPMKPFVSIDIKELLEPPASIRQDAVMDIARLKKDFDQMDRTLVTASPSYIAYALSKHGGFRLIRQDSGRYKHVFQSTHERIFNLALCSDSASSPVAHSESVLATGTNGSVFWTMLPSAGSDQFDEDNIEERGFVFPPIVEDDNSSGAQLKTRAKKSSRHPSFFGIGRGRSIYVIRANIARQFYTNPKTRMVDTEKYLKDYSLKISTGKAGKDFTFSEDDTVIVSLDKAGKMKFWDVRELTQTDVQGPGGIDPVEVKTPLLTFSTSSPDDKTWPTSVIFLDKEKASTKGIALRYLIVGMKQNHCLQLWDLGLGKPIQEVNFPHEKESDAVCSIAYHVRTGVLAVGHPTRNSIYLIHVSAPKYNLPPMNQARYIQKLAQRDSALPKPDSTAIMSGIREFSFASKGQLRSLDMLSSPVAVADGFDQDDAMAFELYVMHSKGVTCLRMKREDLGWTKDGKIQHPVEAEKVGAIAVRSLRVPTSPESSEPSLNGDTVPQKPTLSRAVSKETGKKETVPARLSQSQAGEPSTVVSNIGKADIKPDARSINGTEKGDKKKKKKAGGPEVTAQSTTPSLGTSQPLTSPSYAQAAQGAQTPQKPATASTAVAPPSHAVESRSTVEDDLKKQDSTAALDAIQGSDIKRIEERVSSSFSAALHKELDALYRRFDDDKRVQDAAGAAKQDAVLRLVSSTLTENVEKSLSRIVSTNMQTSILPVLTQSFSSTVERKLNEVLTSVVSPSIQNALKTSLPGAVSRILQDPEFVKLLSDAVAEQMATQVNNYLSKAVRSTIQGTIQASLTDLPARVAQQVTIEMERRDAEKQKQAELQHVRDNSKIDQLTGLVRGLSETVHTMAAAQSQFQSEILKLQRQLAQAREGSVRSETSVRTASTSTKSPEEKELDEITDMFRAGNYTDGTVRWLQSTHQAELFDQFFYQINPSYTQTLSQLVMLSVVAAATATMETKIPERLNWLEVILPNLNPQDDEVAGVFRQIMDVLLSRLQRAYMEIAESGQPSPVLRRISMLVRKASELRVAAP